jgi:chromosome segregation ATPase
MKKINVLAAFAAAILITAGCSKQPGVEPESDTNSVATNSVSGSVSNAWEATKGAATNAWQDTKEASTNAWDKTKAAFGAGMTTNEVSTNYFSDDFSQKDAFVAEARTTLDNLDQRIYNLENKVAGANDKSKANLQQDIQDLKNKRADLDRKYEDLKNSTQYNWNDVKTAFETSYYSVRDSLRSAWHSLTNNT